MVSNPVSDARRAGLGIASLIAAGLGGAEALLDGDQVPRGQRPDPPGAARSCDRQASRPVARQLADMCRGSAGGSHGGYPHLATSCGN